MPVQWFRSLYWRIAVGFVACLAAMLVVQALLLIFVASRSGPTLPGVPPDRFARAVAQDLSQMLERDGAVDVQAFLRDQYGREAHPVFVVLADGREFSNGGGPPPDELVSVARTRLRIARERGTFGGPDAPFEPGLPPEGRPPLTPGEGPRPRPPGARGLGPGFRLVRPAPIVVNNRLSGFVVVPARAPFWFLLSRYAPTLGVVAVGSLVVGALLTALLLFGPPRRRLRAVEEAARHLGGGDLTARAPDHGGDEIAAVATAFNAMADALAASDRTRRQLLADVSHELTTPVTAMRGYLETLTMPDFPLDDLTRARYLGIVADETSRLERIIGDLLDLARLEGGGGTLSIETIPVAELFDRVVARHERTAAAARVRLTRAIGAGADTVHGDRNRLEQALQNLAANALRYAPSDSAIELGARAASDAIVLSVTDRGPGIAPEHLPHLFDRFYKAEASRATTAGAAGAGPEGRAEEGGRVGLEAGSGLGLSIVKAIVERHGGRVTARSRPGETIFELTIPARAAASPARLQTPS